MKTQIRRKNSSRALDVQRHDRNVVVRRDQLSESGAIFLRDIYDALDGKPFCDAMAEFGGLAELLVGNNAPEARAIKQMVQAEAQLNRIRDKVRN
jgi:hypothetical protein